MLFAQPKLIPYLKKDKWGFCNAKKKLIIPAEYDSVEPFQEGFALVEKGGKYAFVDENGKILNNTWYKMAESFSEGLAAVKNETNSYGYIDKGGITIIPFQYKTAASFVEGLAQAGDYGDMYVIDKKGNKISSTYDFIGSYNNGFAAYDAGTDNWGFLNRKGEAIGNDYYYSVGDFGKEGLAAVKSGEGGQLLGFIDTSGKVVISCQYENAWMSGFSEGLAAVSKDGKYGFIDTKGNWVVEAQYAYAVGFHEGLSCVFLNGRCGFIDKKGKVVVPIKYRASIEGDFNFYFNNGLAGIFDPEKGKLGFINKKGKVVLPFIYNYNGSYVHFRNDGIVLLPTPENYMRGAYIDKKGNKYWEGVEVPAAED